MGRSRRRGSASFKRLVARDRSLPAARAQLISALAHSPDRSPEVVTHADAYLREFGDDLWVHLHLGAALHGLGEEERAREHAGIALRMATHGGNSWFQAFIHGGVLQQELGDQETAEWIWRRGLQLVEKRLQIAPGNSQFRIARANLLAHLGDQEAFEAEVRSLPPDTPWLFTGLVQGYAALGDVEETAKHARDALREGHLWYVLIALGHNGLMDTRVAETLRAHSALAREVEAERKRLRDLYLLPEDAALVAQ